MNDADFIIIGANGQLGTALQQKYPKARAVDVDQLDITSYDSVQAFDWTKSKVILNAAAYTNVDGAETTEGRPLAWQVNAVGPSNLAAVASKYDLTLVHISTDYVFDGRNPNHTELESFSPLSVYGQSKAAGDLVTSLVPKHYILRTSWVIGEGKNFVRTMLELGSRGVSPTVVADQIGRLTFTAELVRVIDHLLQTNPPYGTYNATNSGQPASWADITREIFKIAGFKLSVSDTTTADYFKTKPDSAARPLSSVMDLSKLTSTGFSFNDWHEGLRNYIAKEKKQ